ncbi:hypothetical protein [Streptomyces subrutilus]|uniref:Uncharacterized protein n=1 Tax=Streptomyces subrutilus TaxID=36818 RepID=A0A5P2UD78_9ACTN|nr:hypothetical protein [Streptomyces subrutilus]QEU77172.1 hypothetical protein CP968_01630 [Streptomyces subrutilus]WSJ33862.1 hypothetical protein OG479_33620 [Streptomyces subrutilus]GGZ45128.1 hypothetical protein GCM10010371_00090 [Streptomyces subrutilus]
MKLFRNTLPAGALAVALGAAIALGAYAPAGAAASLASCRQTVARTKADLSNAGAPTNANGWQDVRDAAQRFVSSHPWNSPATQALQRDINDLNAQCAP